MEVNADELMMILVAYEGKADILNLKDGSIKITFKRNTPEWVLRVFRGSKPSESCNGFKFEYDEDGLLTVIPETDDAVKSLGELVDIKKIDMVKAYKYRWLISSHIYDYIRISGDGDFNKFMFRYEDGMRHAGYIDPGMYAFLTLLYQYRLYLVFNLLLNWQTGIIYNEEYIGFKCRLHDLTYDINCDDLINFVTVHAETDTELSYEFLPNNIVVFKIDLDSDITRMIRMMGRDKILAQGLEFAVSQSGLEDFEMDERTKELLIQTFHKEYITHPMLLSPLKADNIADSLLKNLIWLDKDWHTGYFAGKGRIVRTLHDFNKNGSDEFPPCMHDFISKIVKYSNFWYMKLNGDLVYKDNVYKLKAVECDDPLKVIDTALKIPACNTQQLISFKAKILKLQALRLREANSDFDNGVRMDLKGDFECVDVFKAFALYNIVKNGMNKDICLDSLITNIFGEKEDMFVEMMDYYKLLDKGVILAFLANMMNVTTFDGFHALPDTVVPENIHILRKENEFIDHVLFNLAIDGMASFLLEAEEHHDQNRDIIDILLGCMLIIDHLDIVNGRDRKRSKLYDIARGESRHNDEAKMLITFCAALNYKTYSSYLYSSYVTEYMMQIPDDVGEASKMLSDLLDYETVHDLYIDLSDAIESDDVPGPIFRLGCEQLKKIILTKTKAMEDDRFYATAIVNMLDVCCSYCDNPVLLNNKDPKVSITRYDVKFFLLKAYEFSCISDDNMIDLFEMIDAYDQNLTFRQVQDMIYPALSRDIGSRISLRP